jgi:hypothetical protein
MNWRELLLQFLTIFLGAFLAFWLENLRERQQLKSWVKKYLKSSYDELSEQLLEEEEMLKGLPKLLGVYPKFCEDDTKDISDEDWKSLGHVMYSFSKDTSSLLEGEALRVIDARLAKVLSQAEKAEFALLKVNELWSAFHDHAIRAICLKQLLPLSKEEKRQVKSCHELGLKLLEYRQKNLEAKKNLLRELEQRNYHK